MSKNYNKIKKFYDLGLYSNEQIAQFVEKRQLTAIEYEYITGLNYNGWN